MSKKVTEFTDLKYLQRVVIHLYDLLDDIDTAGDMAKNNDKMYRLIVEKLQKKKNDSGVSSPDGYEIHILPVKFKIKTEKKDHTNEN